MNPDGSDIQEYPFHSYLKNFSYVMGRRLGFLFSSESMSGYSLTGSSIYTSTQVVDQNVAIATPYSGISFGMSANPTKNCTIYSLSGYPTTSMLSGLAPTFSRYYPPTVSQCEI